MMTKDGGLWVYAGVGQEMERDTGGERPVWTCLVLLIGPDRAAVP